MKNTLFKKTGSITPGRSVFDLSYEVKGTCDMGWLLPINHLMVTPGDIIELGREIVARMTPLIHPPMHEINVYTWDFFVPFRLIDEEWEDFVGGGWDGRHLPTGSDPISIPRWSGNKNLNNGNGMQTLWDYMCFPEVTPEILPIDYPLRAYNFIYNEYFRDENLEPEIEYPYDRQAIIDADNDTNKPGNGSYAYQQYYNSEHSDTTENDTNLFWGNWEKDYFTTALPFQQRGPSPALPLYGTAELDGIIGSTVFDGTTNSNIGISPPQDGLNLYLPASPYPSVVLSTTNGFAADANFKNWLNINHINGSVNADLSGATAGDVNDLRWAFQLQKFMERNARVGIRYTEILTGRYGQPQQDVRLDRPEYLGGSKSPLIMSEVLQTSETATTPQGSLAGHGITADKTYISKYKVREFGIILTLMCIKPRLAYNSQGLDKEYTLQTPYDLITPEFVNLSENAINNQELYAAGSRDTGIWGFQGRYDEYRNKRSKTCSLMRNDFKEWHLARIFEEEPSLSTQFIKINPAETKRIFAIQNEHGFIYNIANLIKAVRPLPIIAEPGLIDHH